MMTDEPKQPWGPVATAGQLQMVAFTHAALQERRMESLPDYAFAAIIQPDDERENFLMHFRDVALLLGFIDEMAPRTVALVGADDENVVALESQIAAHMRLLH